MNATHVTGRQIVQSFSEPMEESDSESEGKVINCSVEYNTDSSMNGNCSLCIRTNLVNSYQYINFDIYQTSSSVLLTTTSRWGSGLQQLGINILVMVLPFVTIDGMSL